MESRLLGPRGATGFIFSLLLILHMKRSALNFGWSVALPPTWGCFARVDDTLFFLPQWGGRGVWRQLRVCKHTYVNSSTVGTALFLFVLVTSLREVKTSVRVESALAPLAR